MEKRMADTDTTTAPAGSTKRRGGRRPGTTNGSGTRGRKAATAASSEPAFAASRPGSSMESELIVSALSQTYEAGLRAGILLQQGRK
jgi:hypothetical protein